MAGTNQPSQKPDGGGQRAGGGRGYSGVSGGNDPTTEPGQYPPASDGGIFGGPLPTGTGAPGKTGGRGGGDDTTEPGQLTDGLTGVDDSDITSTGAPGTSTSPGSGGGGTSVTYTKMGSHLTGTYQSETSSETLTGPGESTEANSEGYATGGPQLPGIKGNEPVPGGKYQPGSGRVLRGGRAVRG
jgi:hypothetical protein